MAAEIGIPLLLPSAANLVSLCAVFSQVVRVYSPVQSYTRMSQCCLLCGVSDCDVLRCHQLVVGQWVLATICSGCHVSTWLSRHLNSGLCHQQHVKTWQRLQHNDLQHKCSEVGDRITISFRSGVVPFPVPRGWTGVLCSWRQVCRSKFVIKTKKRQCQSSCGLFSQPRRDNNIVQADCAFSLSAFCRRYLTYNQATSFLCSLLSICIFPLQAFILAGLISNLWHLFKKHLFYMITSASLSKGKHLGSTMLEWKHNMHYTSYWLKINK